MELQGRHVVVTGGSRGIGEHLVAGARRRGAAVTAVARTEDTLREVTQRLGAAAVVADLASSAGRAGLVERVEREHGPVDVLLLNAGVDVTGGMLEVGAAEVEAAVATNLTAPIELARQALPGMLARGAGCIAFTSSGYSTVAAPGLATYCATKAGLSHFAGALAMELRGSPVSVTLVEPGPVRTDLVGPIVEHRMAGAAIRRLVQVRLTRWSEPQEVAEKTLAAVESGRRYVAVPRRMGPALALARLPRAVGDLVQTGVPRR